MKTLFVAVALTLSAAPALAQSITTYTTTIDRSGRVMTQGSNGYSSDTYTTDRGERYTTTKLPSYQRPYVGQTGRYTGMGSSGGRYTGMGSR